jgi:hypothetical protein
MVADPREHPRQGPEAATRVVGPISAPDEPSSNPLLPAEPVLDRDERKRQAETLPPEMEEKLQERRRRQVEADYVARHGPADRRRDELAGMLARGEIDTAAYAAAIRALDEEQEKTPPPEHAERVIEDPWQHVGTEAEWRLRAVVERGLPAVAILDPKDGRPHDAWQLEVEERDTSGFLKLGPCRAMGESEEANQAPANLLEDDPRLLSRIRWRRRGEPKIMMLSDEELAPLPTLEDDRCPQHDEVLTVVDRAQPAQALCRSPSGQHYVGVAITRDEYGREVVRVRGPEPRVRGMRL